MIKTAKFRNNTLDYIYRVSDRNQRQERINKALGMSNDTLSLIKLTVWECVLTEYSNEFTLRKSSAFAEWFAAQWDNHNKEIINHVLPIVLDFSSDNYVLYQRMKFAKIYPNEGVIELSRREYADSISLTIK